MKVAVRIASSIAACCLGLPTSLYSRTSTHLFYLKCYANGLGITTYCRATPNTPSIPRLSRGLLAPIGKEGIARRVANLSAARALAQPPEGDRVPARPTSLRDRCCEPPRERWPFAANQGGEWMEGLLLAGAGVMILALGFIHYELQLLIRVMAHQDPRARV